MYIALKPQSKTCYPSQLVFQITYLNKSAGNYNLIGMTKGTVHALVFKNKSFIREVILKCLVFDLNLVINEHAVTVHGIFSIKHAGQTGVETQT